MALEKLVYADGATTLHGYLSYQDTGGRRPGVLVVPEAPGLTEHAKRRVGMLSDLGYVALGVDLYGQGRLADGMEETMSWVGNLRGDVRAWRARIAAALAALRRHERVDGARMAAIGYCFGGSSVLELARSGADLRAVASFHGELRKTDVASGSIKPRLLVCHGAEDVFAPREHVAAFQDEMTAAAVDWQLNTYGGAKHGFTIAEADRVGLPAFAYQATADHRSWQALQNFLTESLGANA
jgi:dienelactone hydrolase